MEPKTICRLCELEKPLRKSHLIPSFVYDWLKRSSVTGYLRPGETPNKRVQDGYKPRFLCGDCEQQLGEWEKIFSEKVFVPLHQEKPLEPYGPWLLLFAISVSWRVLTFFKEEGDLSHFPKHLQISVDKALNVWKEVLFEKRPHPGPFEQHMLPFVGSVTRLTDANTPTNINRYIFRSIGMDVWCSETQAFVYVKMCRIILVGFIEMPNRRQWVGTKLHVNHGSFNDLHYKVPDLFRNCFYHNARKAAIIQQNLSDRQQDRIDQTYRKNQDQYVGSEMFNATTQDFALFGEAGFKQVQSDSDST